VAKSQLKVSSGAKPATPPTPLRFVAPQNQLQLAECIAEKAAWWVAMCYAGSASKSLLKVRLRCKAGHALPCKDRQPPQNQLHLALASQKKLHGGL